MSFTIMLLMLIICKPIIHCHQMANRVFIKKFTQDDSLLYYALPSWVCPQTCLSGNVDVMEGLLGTSQLSVLFGVGCTFTLTLVRVPGC